MSLTAMMSPGSSPPALETRSVSKDYGGVTAVDAISLGVPLGQVCGLIGPNGAGKTTFFDLLSGVQPATTGTVLLAGVDITRRSPTWRARHGVRRTFQRQQPFGWLSVSDNLLVALEWEGGSGLVGEMALGRRGRRREQGRRQRVAELLEVLGLTELANEPVARLPIGLVRLVELGRAIVEPPQLLLLDEPTSGLHEAEAERLWGAVERVRAAEGCAVMLVEHDIDFIMRVCERVVVLALGRVLADGTPEEIRADRDVAAVYLGS